MSYFLCLYFLGYYRLSIPKQTEQVPPIDKIYESGQKFIGKPIKEVFDTQFTPHFRNKVAHYILDDGDILNVSTYEVLSEFSNELALIEACVRVVIEVQASYNTVFV